MIAAWAARARGVTLVAAAMLVASCNSAAEPRTQDTDAVTTIGGTTAPGSTTTSDATTSPPATDTGPPPPTEPADDGDVAPVAAPDPTGLPSISEPDDAIVIGELDNGLRYLIRENDNPGGRVEMRLAIDAGSVLEDDDQSGVAHFLEHMLFNGTEEFPANELVAVLRSFGAAFGADINASTSYDETVYQLTMATDDEIVDTGLDVLEQWLTSATIDPGEVEAERGVVLDEWRGSAASSNGRIFDALEDLFLADSPYEDRDPIGTESAIESMAAEPLVRFYDDWYRPDNAAVIVVGDIDAERVEDGIRDRFGDVEPRAEAPPARPDLAVQPSSSPRAVVLADPDVAEGFASVALPLPVATDAPAEAMLQRDILDDLALDIVATRLQNDARRGDAPFEDAGTDSSSFVRSLSAPAIVVSADGPDLEAATQAVFDELERVRRFGFTDAEVALAVASYRTAARSNYEGRESRQDRSFADEYVRHVLEDEPIPTADATFEYIDAVLDRATPATVAYGLVDRSARSAPHVAVVVPQAEAADVPSAETFEEQAQRVAERDLEPRLDDERIDGDLMDAPAPVEEVSDRPMLEFSSSSLVDPRLLTFPNGVQVALNVTPIVEGSVAIEARSPGGLAVVAADSVPDADAAGPVVDSSGVADHGPVALEAFLADKDVDLRSGIDQFTEGFDGFVATEDLEVMFQLIHLRMTEPRVDDIALERYLDDELAYASDPSIDPGYAEFVALRQARYDDPRFWLPTVESLGTVAAAGIAEVYADRFGDASDWAFSLSGDFDAATAVDLARRYLGTLPASGRIENPGFDEPAPPAGIVAETVVAGEGEQARVSFLYTADAAPGRRDRVAAQVAAAVVENRLTDVIRERLGESYSAFSAIELTGGDTPDAETFVSVSTGADLVDSVSAGVLAELDALRRDGPTDAEQAAASEAVFRELQLFNNPQINDEVLSVLVDPAGNPSLEAFVEQEALVETIGADDIREYLAAWTSADRYIEIRTVPR